MLPMPRAHHLYRGDGSIPDPEVQWLDVAKSPFA
jgi:hypothetical protein